MATRTNKFNLVKPELQDAADITAMNENWETIDNEIFNAVHGKLTTITSDDGITYTGTIIGITELYKGLKIYVIPNITGTSKTPTLNLNGLGAKNIIMPIDGTNTVVGSNGAYNDNWFTVAPVTLTYDGTRWKSDVKVQDANSIYGTISIEHGGTGGSTAALAREKLEVYSKSEIETMFSTVLDEINGEEV